METSRDNPIRLFILDNLRDHPRDIAKLTKDCFGISRQAVNRHLHRLVDHGFVEAQGHTRRRVYKLRRLRWETARLPVTRAGRTPDGWRTHILPVLGAAAANVRDICRFAYDAALQNATEHARAERVTIGASATGADIELWVADDGVGIFERIGAALDIDDPRHVILELAKGKLSTSPGRNKGNSLGLLTQMCSVVVLQSGLHVATHRDGGWVVEEKAVKHKGTGLHVRVPLRTPTTVDAVKDAALSFGPTGGRPGFARTVVNVNLLVGSGEPLSSRSQARRVLARLDQFDEATVDFSGVDAVGVPFADEIYRAQHDMQPGTRLVLKNVGAGVAKVIQNVLGEPER